MKLHIHLYNLATDKYRGIIPRVINYFLFLLSLVYGLIVRFIIFINQIKPYHLNCRVISIGNITWGGTGKTSLVAFIAKYLKNRGHKIAILSRGYKKPVTPYPIPVTRYEIMGDEPYMLFRNLGDIPVIADTDRIRAAEVAMHDYGADTVILDDAFQQWRIEKDLEIVTIDATNPFGNWHLIPRGILREPLSSLKRADMFVLTKANINPDIEDIKVFLNSINPHAPIFESIHKPVGFYKMEKPYDLLDTAALKTKIVTLFSGIADPDSFDYLIRNAGIEIGLSFRFPDHYHYLQGDLDKIIKESQKKNIDTLVTTEKDAARLEGLKVNAGGLMILVLRVELEIKDEQGFYSRLRGLYTH